MNDPEVPLHVMEYVPSQEPHPVEPPDDAPEDVPEPPPDEAAPDELLPLEVGQQ